VVQILDGRRSTEVGNGIRDAHALAECHDADFGFEEVDVEFEEYIACDFLF
jgi:hypothetical protein